MVSILHGGLVDEDSSMNDNESQTDETIVSRIDKISPSSYAISDIIDDKTYAIIDKSSILSSGFVEHSKPIEEIE